MPSLPYRPNVGIVLINAQGRIFAGQRFDHSAQAWQMPQGGIDAGEEARTAALRELTEETGVAPDLVEIIGESPDWLYYDLPDDLIPKLWNGAFRGQKQKWFLMRFLGTDDQININTEIPEFSQWAWMGLDDLLNAIVPFKRGVYEEVLAGFADHLKV